MANEIMWLGGVGDNKFIPAMFAGTSASSRLRQIVYPNGIGPLNSWNDPWTNYRNNLIEGERRLAKAIRETDDVPWLCGYSFGAYVVSNFVDHYINGHYPGLYIKGVLTFGNPRKPGGGIAPWHDYWAPGVRALELTAPDDVISNCPPTSVLRKIPYFVEAATGIDPIAGRMDLVRAFSLVLTGAYANMWGLGPREIEMCWKYLDGSGHSLDYFKRGTSYRDQAVGWVS